MKNFRDKVVVITGAGSGIGRALAEAFAARGARCAISDVNAVGLQRTLAKLPGEGHTSTSLDVANKEAFFEYAQFVIREMGGVDIVINNAGVAVSQTVEELSYDDMEWIMNINFWGVVHGTKAFLPHLKKAEEGWVVNISSIFGIVGVPTQGIYNATKFAVRGFTEALSQELAGSSTHALSVHPGGIRTNIAASARFYKDMANGTDQERSAKAFAKAARVTPEEAAAEIVGAIEKRRRRLLIGKDAKAIDALQRAMPSRYGDVTAKLLKTFMK